LRSQRPPSYDDEVVSQPVQIGKGGVVASMDDEENDDMFKDAVAVVATAGKASTSLLQRKLRVGYGRASRMMDIMEERGIIGPADGAKPRQVLVSSADEVFGTQDVAPTEQPQPVPAVAEEGDIYDEIPDDE
jgi:DNA segregation ATPase FtsK/SpoIIIE, S-DNA-T family